MLFYKEGAPFPKNELNEVMVCVDLNLKGKDLVKHGGDRKYSS
jgi:hypothetical protein